jgi:hypothetical protein
MNRNLKVSKQHADYSGKTMESRDHSKKGASPKSQTSKKNFLRSDKGTDRKSFRKRSLIYGIFIFLILLIIFPDNLFGQINAPSLQELARATLAKMKKNPNNDSQEGNNGNNQGTINPLGVETGKPFTPSTSAEVTPEWTKEYEQKQESLGLVYEKKIPTTRNKGFDKAFEQQQETYNTFTRNNKKVSKPRGRPLAHVYYDGPLVNAENSRIDKRYGRPGAFGGFNDVRASIGKGLGKGQMGSGKTVERTANGIRLNGDNTLLYDPLAGTQYRTSIEANIPNGKDLLTQVQEKKKIEIEEKISNTTKRIKDLGGETKLKKRIEDLGTESDEAKRLNSLLTNRDNIKKEINNNKCRSQKCKNEDSQKELNALNAISAELEKMAQDELNNKNK